MPSLWCAQPLFCRMQNLMKAGKPLVLTETLPVLENKWYGTQGGFNVQVVFVVLDVSTNFEKALPMSMQEELKSGKTQKAIEYEFAVGCITENLGLLALLQRKAPKVGQIRNSDKGLNLSIVWCKFRFE